MDLQSEMIAFGGVIRRANGLVTWFFMIIIYTYYAGHIFTIIQTEMEVCYKWLWDFKITKMPSDNPETRLEKNSLKLFQNSLSALYGFQ